MTSPKVFEVEAGPDSPAVALYAGFDISTYPGNTLMSVWWTYSPFSYVGFYLAPAPNHTDPSWMAKRSFLKNMGWGFLPIYNGQQAASAHLTASQGTADANDAAALAAQAGFPAGTYLFLDIETGGTLSPQFITYIHAWVQQVDLGTNFWAGIYCSSYQTAAQIKAAIGTLQCRFWCFNVNCPPSPGCSSAIQGPANCGYSGALVWQYAQSPKPKGITCSGYTTSGCGRRYNGQPPVGSLYIDLDTSTSPNPSNG